MPKHPCPELNKAYEGYQGQKPDSAKFIFIGLDANFSPNIWNSPSSKFFEEVLEYLKDGVKYWNKEQTKCPRYRHHPFLSPDYGKGPGYRYHLSFSKMGLTCKYADKISFVELLPFPTCNTNSRQFMGLFQDVRYIINNKAHLDKIDLWINSSEYIKEIFIPMGVYTKMCELKKQQYGCFDWLPINWLSAPPNPFKFKPNTLYTSQALTNKSKNVRVITHFSNAISDKHLKEIGMIIQS